ncbi:MAG: extracellular solute-binding protein [Treponema sp.]|jgi:raffinose/stachyose/melibiose transport system substrate-binding protein|nr:extracellular solute-binding protein [Treponema sp.]
MKRNKRLALDAAAIFVFAMVCFSGCTRKNDRAEKKGPVTITLGMHVANTKAQEPVTYAIVQKFMEENPDITIKIEGNDKDEHVKKMKMAAQINDLPDIFWMDSSVAPEMSKAGYLLDLNEFLDEYPAVAAAIPANMKNACSKNGVQYGLPYQSLVTGFWYNKALFKKYGIPEPVNGTTYDELLSMVKKFRANGIVPVEQGAKDPYSVWGFLIGIARYGYFNRIDAILAKTDSFTNPDFEKYFEKLYELGKNGAFPENTATMNYFQAKQDFIIGKGALFDSGMWDAGELDKSIGDTIGFWWGPVFSDVSYPQKLKMKVSSAPFCVSKNVSTDETRKKAVFKFLAFYYGKEAAEISYKGSIIPATDYTTDVDLSDKPAFKAIVAALNEKDWVSPVAQPDLVLSESVQAQLYDSLYGAMLNTYKPKDALAKIDAVLSQQ